MSVPNEEAQKAIGVPGQRLDNLLQDLESLDTIQSDDGQEKPFEGHTKRAFIDDIREGYSIVKDAVENLHFTGQFLFQVRERQKEDGLWGRYLETMGLAPRTANRFIRVYERFRQKLLDYSYLGITKLEMVARLKEPVAFTEQNKDDVETLPSDALEKKIQAEKQKTAKGKPKKTEPRELEVGSYRIAMSANGRVLKVLNLKKDLQKELAKVINDFLSKKK